MQDIFHVLASRRTTKRFTSQPLPFDEVLQIIQAGELAPSSGDIQNWAFIIITENSKIKQMYEYAMEQECFLSAQVAVLVVGDGEYANRMYGLRGKKLYTVQNCAAAIQNMLLAATALGIGSAWIGGFDEDAISSMASIPAGKRIQGIVLLGYPEEEPEPKKVKPLDDIVFFNSYGSRVEKPHLIYYNWAEEWRQRGEKVKATLEQHKTGIGKKVRLDDGQKEKLKQSIDSTKGHIQKIIDSLKKEEYR